MLIRTAKEIATRWVHAELTHMPGFAGAFFHGSVNWMEDDDELPPASDLDVIVVLDPPHAEGRMGKFVHQGLLIEASPLPFETLASAEAVLVNYPIVGGFRRPGIIADPTGHLTRLQAEIAPEYARRRWVEARCAAARRKVMDGVAGIQTAEEFHDRVTAWLFSAGVVTHILLVAGLENPTVRRRYVAVRDLLDAYELAGLYDRLLALIGVQSITAQQAAAHLSHLDAAFAAAGHVLTSPYRFAADMQSDARPVAIEGSRALIEAGDHREAIFWMAAVYSRCLHVLTVDGSPRQRDEHAQGYRALLGDLGIGNDADLVRGGAQTLALLPDVDRAAREIVARTPGIT